MKRSIRVVMGSLLPTLMAWAMPIAANEWVSGRVRSVEDYGSYNGGAYEVMVDLKEKVWVNSGDSGSCNERFRIIVGAQGVTEENKKRFFAMLLAAYISQAKVRLFYSTDGMPYCHVQIVSIGDF